jgi:hypothetical protein
MEDHEVLEHISRLVAEEHELRAASGEGHGLDDESRERMTHLEVQLDQCWDLLRRRQAKEEFGLDPDREQTRPETIVEHYRQ